MWKRWLKYAKAKVETSVRGANETLDRKEAELDARRQGKPWLDEDDGSPSFDSVKARIEAEQPSSSPSTRAGSGDPSFDLAKQQKAADDRLKDIRKELDLDS